MNKITCFSAFFCGSGCTVRVWSHVQVLAVSFSQEMKGDLGEKPVLNQVSVSIMMAKYSIIQ